MRTEADRQHVDGLIEHYLNGRAAVAVLQTFFFGPIVTGTALLFSLPAIVVRSDIGIPLCLLMLFLGALITQQGWKVRSGALRRKRELLAATPQPCRYEMRLSSRWDLGLTSDRYDGIVCVIAELQTSDADRQLRVLIGPRNYFADDFRPHSGLGRLVGDLNQDHSLLETADGIEGFLTQPAHVARKRLPSAWHRAASFGDVHSDQKLIS